MTQPAAAEPSIDVPSLVTVLLAKETHPNWWAANALTWENLVRRLQWRYAKTLMETHPDLVSSVVERLVAGRNGTESNTDAWMCLGMVRRRRGDYEAAIVAFMRLWLRDEDVRAGYNIGLCLKALGRLDEARAAFEAVLSLRPRDEKALTALAELLS